MTQTRKRVVGNATIHEADIGNLMPRREIVHKTRHEQSTMLDDGDVLYHVRTGAKVLSPIDARDALSRHSSEWSATPWPGQRVYRKSEAPAAPASPMRPLEQIIHHKKNGPAKMYAVDADNAVRQHPDEWARDAWPEYQAPAPVVAPPPRAATSRKIFHVTTGAVTIGIDQAGDLLARLPRVWRERPWTPEESIRAIGEWMWPAGHPHSSNQRFQS